MHQKPKIFNADQNAETREEIHAEVRDWFPTAESLAQQLGTDARRLAQCYPAPNTAALLAQMLREQAAAAGDLNAAPMLSIAASDEGQPPEDIAPRKTNRHALWHIPQVAAAVLVLVAGWSLLRWSAEKPLNPGRDLHNKIAEQPRDTAVLPVAIPHAPLEPHEFQTLSAPEREAVLDLLEEQALGTVSLSI